MNRLHTLLLPLLLLATVGLCTTVHADELKDISQLASQGQHAQVLEKVNAYLTSHPGDVSGLFLKGVILTEQNKSADAIRIFTAITEAHPELPEPYNNLAVLYADQGQYDKACLALEKAIKSHPSYATAHENLGDIYAKMASDVYDKALQLDSSNARAKTKLSLVKELFSSGNIGSASTPKPEEPAKIKVAAAPPPAPAETAKPPEPKAKPASASASVAKEKDKPVENPSPKEEPKVGS
jgi:tetratricopeptide (TPR) repeat protein